MNPVSVRVATGDVVGAPGSLALNVDGTVIPTIWLGNYIPRPGDAVRALISDGLATVLGPVATTPRPSEGTVAGAAVGGLVPVDTVSGQVMARFAGAAPSVSELVLLDWQATQPRLLGGAATADPDPPPSPDPTELPPPPPSTPKSGLESIAAVQSSTYGAASGWDRYGDSVNQYRWGSESESTGAWFYGSRLSTLQGATITSAQIYLPARRRIGSYNSSATLNLYRHTSGRRPSGNVNRTGSSEGVSIPAGWSGGWRAIPAAFAQALVDNGGGIAIHGSPYAGVLGLSDSPSSGRLRLNWTRS